MPQESATSIGFMLSAAALGWWLVAPFLVMSGDPRLKERSPDHAARLVRFYRLWGTLAVGLGAAIAYVVGAG